MFRFFFSTALFLTFALPPAYAKTVLLENFSSKSCGYAVDSEPHINAIAQEQDDVLVLGCHIDFEGSRRSDLAIESCSLRKQRYYHYHRMLDPRSPMVLVNGRYDTKGDYTHIVDSAVKLAKTDDIFSIPMQKNETGFSAALPGIEDPDRIMNLWFFAYTKVEEGQVFQVAGHTHNKDGTITYHDRADQIDYDAEPLTVEYRNVVRVLKKLGDWTGAPETIGINVDTSKYDGYVVIAQDLNLGPVRLIASFEKDE